MPENGIIAGIHRHREAVARKCGYDVAKPMACYRRRDTERADAGHPLVSFVKSDANETCIVREEPPAE
ncbi:MAG: hypothetical protein ABI318_22995 [Chthoniobacteraceae bacterium]